MNLFEYKSLINQQQLAGIVVLTSWHPWQTTSVSLQLSQQKGTQKRTPVVTNKQQHQAKVTPPIFVLMILSVSFLHIWH